MIKHADQKTRATVFNRRGWAGVIGAGLCAVALAACVEAPEADSPTALGVAELLMTDPARGEDFTPEADDRREIVIRAWYPAQESEAPVAAYFSPDEAAYLAQLLGGGPEMQTAVGEIGGALRLRAQEDAPVRGSAATYPTVVFLPGLYEMPEFYSGLAEKLADSGYMVLAVNHPFDSVYTRLSGGRVATHDALLDPSSDTPETQGAYRDRAVKLRVADTCFLLDALRTQEPGQHPLLAHVDPDRIVLAGHSVGGSALSTMTCTENVAAMIVLDANSATPVPAIEVPLLVLQSQEAAIEPTMAELVRKSRAGGFHAVIPDSYHQSFTDKGLIARDVPALAAALDVASLVPDAAPVSKLIEDLTVAFLSRFVRGSDDGALEEMFEALGHETTVTVVQPASTL